ncbi:MAG TPA: carbonic anhydrase [Rhizomicrobium sp.]|nr:carbonic anhydrase [Rhizomicrobium sp.]
MKSVGESYQTMFPERLAKGYHAFIEGRFAVERGRYQNLAGQGQSPRIMVIGCVDSRVSPEVIFDAAPGEILVARNVANLVPRYDPPTTPEDDISHQHGTSAALEFAVRALKVRHIVVLGHAFCGGIKAFASDQAPLTASDFIGRWMSQIAPAADAITAPKEDGESYLRQLEFASVELSLNNLMTFPFVRSAVEEGTLSLHGAYFGVASGKLLVRNETTGAFEPV